MLCALRISFSGDGRRTCPYVVGALHHPKSILSQYLAARHLPDRFCSKAVKLFDSRLSLTVGSSGSIWAPWSLISMFCDTSGKSTLHCSVFGVFHSARHSLCLVFGSGSSEAGGNCTLQLTRVTWLLLTRAAGQVLQGLPWILGPVREIPKALNHCPHLDTCTKCSRKRCKCKGR